ncbi:calcium-binding protein [Streptomyces sp. NPDC059396]|uniref:calcium-binding protein n=1 Tax=Streptomyces sp. NPDC059396 TaxID=3346819 RepID=UPI00369D7FBA
MFSLFAGPRAPRAAAALTVALGTGLALPFILGGTASAAAPSATAEFSSTDQAIVYTAAAGQTNDLVVTSSKAQGVDEITYVIDDTVPITAGTDCRHPDPADLTTVSCTVATLETQDPYDTLRMVLGDGDDAVSYTNGTGQAYYTVTFELGEGDDTLTESGYPPASRVGGGPGDDLISVGEASVVRGDDGDDEIRAQAGTLVFGDAGADVIYSIGDAAQADGGAGDDEIWGSYDQQHLWGGDDNDVIHGAEGGDFLYGGRGNDVLYGDGGDDTIYGNTGDDKLYGGAGTDTLSGGAGTNVVQQD